MYHFFCVHALIKNKANEDVIAVIEKLFNGNVVIVEEENEIPE